MLCCSVLSQYNVPFFHNELMFASAPTGAGRYFKSIYSGPLPEIILWLPSHDGFFIQLPLKETYKGMLFDGLTAKPFSR